MTTTPPSTPTRSPLQPLHANIKPSRPPLLPAAAKSPVKRSQTISTTMRKDAQRRHTTSNLPAGPTAASSAEAKKDVAAPSRNKRVSFGGTNINLIYPHRQESPSKQPPPKAPKPKLASSPNPRPPRYPPSAKPQSPARPPAPPQSHGHQSPIPPQQHLRASRTLDDDDDLPSTSLSLPDFLDKSEHRQSFGLLGDDEVYNQATVRLSDEHEDDSDTTMKLPTFNPPVVPRKDSIAPSPAEEPNESSRNDSSQIVNEDLNDMLLGIDEDSSIPTGNVQQPGQVDPIDAPFEMIETDHTTTIAAIPKFANSQRNSSSAGAFMGAVHPDAEEEDEDEHEIIVQRKRVSLSGDNVDNPSIPGPDVNKPNIRYPRTQTFRPDTHRESPRNNRPSLVDIKHLSMTAKHPLPENPGEKDTAPEVIAGREDRLQPFPDDFFNDAGRDRRKSVHSVRPQDEPQEAGQFENEDKDMDNPARKLFDAIADEDVTVHWHSPQTDNGRAVEPEAEQENDDDSMSLEPYADAETGTGRGGSDEKPRFVGPTLSRPSLDGINLPEKILRECENEGPGRLARTREEDVAERNEDMNEGMDREETLDVEKQGRNEEDGNLGAGGPKHHYSAPRAAKASRGLASPSPSARRCLSQERPQAVVRRVVETVGRVDAVGRVDDATSSSGRGGHTGTVTLTSTGSLVLNENVTRTMERNSVLTFGKFMQGLKGCNIHVDTETSRPRQASVLPFGSADKRRLDSMTVEGQASDVLRRRLMLRVLREEVRRLEAETEERKRKAGEIEGRLEGKKAGVFKMVCQLEDLDKSDATHLGLSLKRLRKVKFQEAKVGWARSRMKWERGIGKGLKREVGEWEEDERRGLEMCERLERFIEEGGGGVSEVDEEALILQRRKVVHEKSKVNGLFSYVEAHEEEGRELGELVSNLKKEKEMCMNRLGIQKRVEGADSTQKMQKLVRESQEVISIASGMCGVAVMRVDGKGVDLRLGGYADVRMSVHEGRVINVSCRALRVEGDKEEYQTYVDAVVGVCVRESGIRELRQVKDMGYVVQRMCRFVRRARKALDDAHKLLRRYVGQVECGGVVGSRGNAVEVRVTVEMMSWKRGSRFDVVARQRTAWGCDGDVGQDVELVSVNHLFGESPSQREVARLFAEGIVPSAGASTMKSMTRALRHVLDRVDDGSTLTRVL